MKNTIKRCLGSATLGVVIPAALITAGGSIVFVLFFAHDNTLEAAVTAVVVTTTIGVITFLAASRVVERNETARRSKSLALASSKIASTVGKTAPIVRELHARVRLLESNFEKLGQIANQSLGMSPSPSRTDSSPSSSPLPRPKADAATVVAGNTKQPPQGLIKLIDASEEAGAAVEVPRTGKSFSIDAKRLESIHVVLTPRSGKESGSAKGIVVSARVFNSQGHEITCSLLKSFNERFGSFSYLDTRQSSASTFSIRLPQGADRLEFSLTGWDGDAKLVNAVAITQKPEMRATPFQREIRMATILDEFSYNSFRPECITLPLSPHKWKEELDTFRPDLFFCESAWSGHDSTQRPWKGRVYASNAFPKENRHEILGILEYCKERGIPTVFWNKEDPSHYDDARHNFVDTALKFDHIFTTDSDCIERYRVEHGHQSVHSLPFAVQPKLFNPVERSARSKAAVFAGGWYANHVSRSKDMEKILDSLLDSGRKLKIYDRYFGTDDELHIYPAKYQEFLEPPRAHETLGEVYKESDVGVTFNTETKSPTMFARRIFELMACNTLVVSNYSKGVAQFFGDDVVFLDQDPGALTRLTEHDIVQKRESALNKVLAHHTYSHRLRRILEVVDVPFTSVDDKPGLVVHIARESDVVPIAQAISLSRDNFASATMILADTISPLAIAEHVASLQGDYLTLVAEQHLLSGKTKSSSLGDFSTSSLLISADALSGLLQRPNLADDVERLLLHSQYMMLPIVEVSSTKRYTVDHRSGIDIALVPTERLAETVGALKASDSLLSYGI